MIINIRYLKVRFLKAFLRLKKGVFLWLDFCRLF